MNRVWWFGSFFLNLQMLNKNNWKCFRTFDSFMIFLMYHGFFDVFFWRLLNYSPWCFNLLSDWFNTSLIPQAFADFNNHFYLSNNCLVKIFLQVAAFLPVVLRQPVTGLYFCSRWINWPFFFAFLHICVPFFNKTHCNISLAVHMYG